ncbi:MAG: hypothetical protein ACC669_01665 [bacterium]
MRKIGIVGIMGLFFVAGIAFVYSCGGGSSSSAATLNELEDRVLALENKLTPAYDSGWVAIAQGQDLPFSHNVGGNSGDYIVDVKQWTSHIMGLPILSSINNRYIGGDKGSVYQEGIYWYISSSDDGTPLEDNIIRVYRLIGDSAAEKIRVRIWNFGA